MAVLDPKELRVGPAGGRKPSPYAGQTVLQPADLARAAGALPMPEPAPAPMGWGGWKCDAAKWACKNWNLGCGYANSATCNEPKPPAPPPPVYSQVSGKECDSQESPTAKELGLCDEELCNVAAMLDMWSFAPGTNWSNCYVEPNGDPMACRLKCPGAKKALAIGGAGGANGGGTPGCGQRVGPPGCNGKCCFRDEGGPIQCHVGWPDKDGCYGLAKVATGQEPNPNYKFTDVTYDCVAPPCDGG